MIHSSIEAENAIAGSDIIACELFATLSIRHV